MIEGQLAGPPTVRRSMRSVLTSAISVVTRSWPRGGICRNMTRISFDDIGTRGLASAGALDATRGRRRGTIMSVAHRPLKGDNAKPFRRYRGRPLAHGKTRGDTGGQALDPLHAGRIVSENS